MGIIIKPLVTEKMTAITDKNIVSVLLCVLMLINWKLRKKLKHFIMLQLVDVNTMRYDGKNKSRYTKAGMISGRMNALQKSNCYVERRRYYRFL
jgi:large subunit ribosomal protein L23